MNFINRTLLLSAIVLFSLLVGVNKNGADNQRKINNSDISRIETIRRANQGKKINIRQADKKEISNLISHYNFFSFDDLGTTYCLADALNNNDYVNSILEFRLFINNNRSFSSKEGTNINNRPSIEIIKLDSSGNLTKENFSPSLSQIKKILRKRIIINRRLYKVVPSFHVLVSVFDPESHA